MILKGKTVVKGKAEGYALVSKGGIVWSHGVDPQEGIVDDTKSDVYGQSIKDKIFVYPHGKGSTTSSTWILEAVRTGNAPKAIINVKTEIIIATGSILGHKLYGHEMPVLHGFDRDPVEVITTGDYVRVDGDAGTIEIIKKAQ